VTATVDDRLTGEAERILRGERSLNLDEQRSAYESAGWTGFDVTTEPFGDIAAERDAFAKPHRSENAVPRAFSFRQAKK
jgi:hypothetical protein